MTIYEARERKIPLKDVLAYDMPDDEKLAYAFEMCDKEKLKVYFPELYYCLLAYVDKYK